jgi:hypothetical protein
VVGLLLMDAKDWSMKFLFLGYYMKLMFVQ